MDIVEQTKQYAISCHQETNHTYGHHPYEFHLNMVVEAAQEFIHLIPEIDRKHVIAGCWVHDCIEDCRQTYNDIKTATNETIADLAYALTNEKGKTRKERANDNYYQGIKQTPHASFIKCCDRRANVRYSKQAQNQRMLEVYQKENENFVNKIYRKEYQEIFNYLNDLLAIEAV